MTPCARKLESLTVAGFSPFLNNAHSAVALAHERSRPSTRSSGFPFFANWIRGLLFAIAVALASAPVRADAPVEAAPVAQSNQPHDASLDDYRQHLTALSAIVDACAKGRDTKSCDPDLVGPDDRVPLNASTNAPRRLVRYEWLRILLVNAQKSDAKVVVADKNKTADKSAIKTQTEDKTQHDDDSDSDEETTAPTPRTTAELLHDATIRLTYDLAQTNAAPTPIPTHEQQRDAMMKVLAGRDFRNLESPTAKDSILEKISEWLNQLFANLGKISATSAWVGRVIVGGFILLVCVGLIWALIQQERRWRIRLVPESDEPAAGSASARDWQLWLEDARNAAAVGQWREAIHFVYWASISRLESKRLWPADRARTPREYLALVAAEDPRRAGLATLTRSFERIWYGGRAAAQADYRNAEELAIALIDGSGTTSTEGGAR